MSVSFQTNKTGAAATVCSTSTIKYNFSVAQNTTAAKATFAMSKGSSTTASCTVAIYNQPNGAGSIIASVTLTAASFVSSSYPDVVFTFPAGTNLTANTDYSLVITSSTGCNGANAYSLKPGSFQVIDTATATVLNTGYAIAAAPSGHTTAIAAATGSFSLSSANVAVSSLAAAMATNKNYAVAAAAETNTHVDGAAIVEYSLSSNSRVQATFFASTEPFLFIESEITCAAVAASSAVQDIAVQAMLAAVVVAAATGAVQPASAIRFYFGTQPITDMYVGDLKITNAYLGSTQLLDQPN